MSGEDARDDEGAGTGGGGGGASAKTAEIEPRVAVRRRVSGGPLSGDAVPLTSVYPYALDALDQISEMRAASAADKSAADGRDVARESRAVDTTDDTMEARDSVGAAAGRGGSTCLGAGARTGFGGTAEGNSNFAASRFCRSSNSADTSSNTSSGASEKSPADRTVLWGASSVRPVNWEVEKRGAAADFRSSGTGFTSNSGFDGTGGGAPVPLREGRGGRAVADATTSLDGDERVEAGRLKSSKSLDSCCRAPCSRFDINSLELACGCTTAAR
jgi:hypothetical protein